MTARSPLACSLVLLACCTEGIVEPDASSELDAPSGDHDAVVRTEDDAWVAARDAFVTPADAYAPDATLDGGPWPTGACEPAAGSERFDDTSIHCAGTTELAVMRGIDAPHLAVHAAVQILARSTTDCIAVDVAQLLAPDGSVLADLGAGVGRMGNVIYGEPILRADLPAPLATICEDDDDERFDRYLVRLEGRVNGGTFSVTCGEMDAPSTFWPPETAVTCHEGLDRSPASFSAVRMGGALEGRVGIPHGPSGEVLSAEGETSILTLPYTLGFAGRMPAERWPGPTLERSTVSESSMPFWHTQVVTLTVGTTTELGRCAPGDRSLRLIRFGGLTVRGPYVTEAWFPCSG
ncbi:MAG: hypothetical protein J0L92_28295 [Deltaproteobacteria bacterium]|nr:hypothetical protein [Deltaproteobacteria bacterium]